MCVFLIFVSARVHQSQCTVLILSPAVSCHHSFTVACRQGVPVCEKVKSKDEMTLIFFPALSILQTLCVFQLLLCWSWSESTRWHWALSRRHPGASWQTGRWPELALVSPNKINGSGVVGQRREGCKNNCWEQEITWPDQVVWRNVKMLDDVGPSHVFSLYDNK